MKPWKISFSAVVFLLGILLQFCRATGDHLQGVTETAEQILCLVYIDGSASYGKLHEALETLHTVKCQISRLKRDQTATLSAIESLLTLKSQQIAHSDRTIKCILGHLKQVKSALSIALNPDSVKTTWQIPNDARNKLAMEFLSSYVETANDNRAAKIRIIKTGAFLMVMLSTTADVCVITGPVVCFALYVAGSGAVVIWFAQIYQTMFGKDGMPEPNWITR
ncbi:hypothetical protein HG537_0C01860 [Torulaspora globosa]|uniref:Uncharacterized protein n=1 Tax=Torulaspora globosa TaxID=48254 RepID=A0A7H9HQI6_9SACH|nr:hypothetical protein HG537_0C01860 [Torulaspora sp. CBS 2947]